MLEVIREAFWVVNLPFTMLLGFVLLYWALVGVGLLDFDADGGIDVSHGGDVAHPGGDLHADTHSPDVHQPLEGATGALKSMLQFLNFGNVPAMIIVSVMALIAWLSSMIANHYFGNGTIVRALILLAPNIVLTVALTKVLTTPLKKFFNALNRDYEEHKPVIGRTCTIITTEVTDKFGQAQIETSGAPLLINVRTYGDTVLAKGESALIIKEDKESNIYTVARLTTTQQQETSLC